MRRPKRTRTVEPFSMKTRTAVGRVETRREDGEELPCVNVKPPPLYYRIPADLREKASKRDVNYAFESVAEDWWRLVPQDLADHHLAKAFRAEPAAEAAGRSSGWVIVRGLGPVEDWTAAQRRAWGRFETAIKKSMLDAEKDFHDEIRARIEG